MSAALNNDKEKVRADHHARRLWKEYDRISRRLSDVCQEIRRLEESVRDLGLQRDVLRAMYKDAETKAEEADEAFMALHGKERELSAS